MNKIKSLFILLAALIALSACRGVVLDENEVITGNGTDTVIRENATYTYEGGVIKKDGEALASLSEPSDEALFALGEYLYANTAEGTMQIRISDGRVKKFGSGVILAAKGRWIYYKSDLSQARGMSLYKIDMMEGRELLLFEGNPTEVKEDGDTFIFTTEDGKVYTNELNQDEAQEATDADYDYDSILNGDLSQFAGLWENAEGNTLNLQPDGTEGETVINEDDGKTYSQYSSDFEKNSDGSYTWIVCTDIDEYIGDSYGITLYPIGVEVNSYGTVLETDTAKVRLHAGHDLATNADEIYYLQ